MILNPLGYGAQSTPACSCPPGAFRYSDDLLRLEATKPVTAKVGPAGLALVRSPLRERIMEWEARLAGHPDHAFAGYVLHRIRGGFHIGFDRSRPLSPAARNMPSAGEHEEAVEQYIRREVTAGHILGPVAKDVVPRIHVSRLGAVPKDDSKWRVITDLSFPPGKSVNDGVDSAVCSLRYTSVDRVAWAACRLGQVALLAKLDIKSAYRLVPVHPDDRPLLGIQWKGGTYVDGMLPFGLRSAPKIFTAVADALEW